MTYTHTQKIKITEKFWGWFGTSYCASSLIDALRESIGWEDEIQELMGGYHPCAHCDAYGFVECTDSNDKTCEDEDCDDCYGEGEKPCPECEGEGEALVEIYEHWIIPSSLGPRLAEHGEIVVDVCGLTIWGRGCTGQSVALDWSVQQAAIAWYEGLYNKFDI